MRTGTSKVCGCLRSATHSGFTLVPGTANPAVRLRAGLCYQRYSLKQGRASGPQAQSMRKSEHRRSRWFASPSMTGYCCICALQSIVCVRDKALFALPCSGRRSVPSTRLRCASHTTGVHMPVAGGCFQPPLGFRLQSGVGSSTRGSPSAPLTKHRSFRSQ